jgi:hypothetical protein
MQRKEMVEGMAISSTCDFDCECERCTLGKLHCLPFPKASTANYELMDVVAADLTGPMSSPTWTGMRYALVAVEVSTRKAFGRLLGAKSEVVTALKELVALMERQTH